MASIARRGARGIYKLYVGNLPWTISNTHNRLYIMASNNGGGRTWKIPQKEPRAHWDIDELKQYFEKFGPVKSAFVKFDSNLGLTKHFGFVHFFERDTYIAVQAEENHILENVKLIVSTANVGIQTPLPEQPNRDYSRRRQQAIADDD